MIEQRFYDHVFLSIVGLVTVRTGMQPDSLKLSSQLAILKMLHKAAFQLDEILGDKSSGKAFYLRGIQGQVSRPVWNRDYIYLTGKIQEIRKYLTENCVHTVSDDLFSLALDIFSRYDNRRRMGVELIVLAILATPGLQRWEVPEKYHSTYFVIDMLVSCRHRFQKPSAAFFWSKQSEEILANTFRQSASLTKLSLPLCNDILLKAIAVHCRELREIDIQLSLDATEEGLLALAGRSGQPRDQGFHKHWENALYLHKDFGCQKEWYIKDCLLFTPPCSSKRTLPPRQCDSRLLSTFPTGFGCKKLTKFRISGDFIFPPMAARAKFNKYENGPVIESGLYALLMYLPKLTKFTCGFTPLVIARLKKLLPPSQFEKLVLPLEQLQLGWEEALEVEELQAIASLCPRLTELKGVSVGILDDQYRGDRHLQDAVMCNFLKSFQSLTRLSSNLKLTCLNSFLRPSGRTLTSLTCSTLVLSTKDILVIRRYCVNLERLEGRFSVDNTIDRAPGDYHTNHMVEYPELSQINANIDSSWSSWEKEVKKYPWRSLRHLDLNGRLSCRVMQLLIAKADSLETLHMTNWPNEMVAGGMAFDDSWIPAILEANSLINTREFTLRMDGDHYVEEGFLTKKSLSALLNHAIQNCLKLEKIVGEWTKVPDREIIQMEDECAKKGLSVKIRNAEPYREFQNSEDNDRFYGMNEGYWRNQAINPPPNLPNGPAPLPVQPIQQLAQQVTFSRQSHHFK